jgi:hypothetical protein
MPSAGAAFPQFDGLVRGARHRRRDQGEQLPAPGLDGGGSSSQTDVGLFWLFESSEVRPAALARKAPTGGASGRELSLHLAEQGI